MVHHQHGVSGHGRAVGAEGVQVPVHPRDDHVERTALDPVEVGEDRGSDEPVLGSVEVGLTHVYERFERLPGEARVGLSPPEQVPLGVPRVELALEVRTDDVLRAVVV